MSRMAVGFAAISLACCAAGGAFAQTPSQPAQAQVQAQAPAQELLKPDELDQLVAPIALYPDALLSEVLMASTYPLEVVEADRWANANKKLKGDQLKAAADKQGWDDSLKSLVATPSVLTMMSSKLDWTQKLGDAVLAQQADVMDAIQRLRAKAQAQNTLKTTKEQRVSVQPDQGKQVIVIEPAVPDTVYVPYYNPSVVYGAWPYPSYPPYYFPPPVGYVAGAAIATGVAFGVGYAVGRWASGGNYWGGGLGWGGGSINVNRSTNINISGNSWQHNSAHRRGVAYNNTNVRQQFGNNNIRAGNQTRLDFRGRSGNQVLQPGGNRPNIGGGDRPNLGGGGGGNRPGLGGGGDRLKPGGGGDRPTVGGGGDRPKLGGGGGPKRDGAFGNIQSGKLANAASARGHTSLGGGAGGGGRLGGGGARLGGGGGRPGGGGGRLGGGRRR